MQRKNGYYINFGLRDNRAKTIRVSTTSCVSTSAECAGHYTTVRSTGRIVGVTDKVTASPQTAQDGAEPELA
jgi:hypothetical protein